MLKEIIRYDCVRCPCCPPAQSLLCVLLHSLGRLGKFDYLLIESSGISEPMPVAEAFTFGDDDGSEVKDFATVDTMVDERIPYCVSVRMSTGCVFSAQVTVVDAFSLFEDYSGGATLQVCACISVRLSVWFLSFCTGMFPYHYLLILLDLEVLVFIFRDFSTGPETRHLPCRRTCRSGPPD